MHALTLSTGVTLHSASTTTAKCSNLLLMIFLANRNKCDALAVRSWHFILIKPFPVGFAYSRSHQNKITHNSTSISHSQSVHVRSIVFFSHFVCSFAKALVTVSISRWLSWSFLSRHQSTHNILFEPMEDE